LSFALLSTLFLTGPAAARPPDVLLITLDTTRADRMGFLGSTRGLTPSLDRFAKTAVVFERAYAQAPITTVSHATILTGTYPAAHGVDQLGAPLSPSVPYLPDLLRRAGYRTAAFVASLVLDPKQGTAPGFDRGFDVYDAGFRLRRPGEDRYQTVERRGDEVVRRAIGSIGGAAPLFLWVHLFDPHDPYDAASGSASGASTTPVSVRYDAEITAVDRAAGRLIDAARPNTLVVVAADHGEALGEHGEATHGVFLYDETMRVPLAIRLPDGRGAAVRVASRVRLADVAPTVLQAIGAPVPAAMAGESLLPLLSAPRALDRAVYAETRYPRQAFGWAPLASWRSDRFLFVKAPRRELYDLAADPAASRNIADARARVADGMDAELREFVAGRAGTAGGQEGRKEGEDGRMAGRPGAAATEGQGARADGRARIDPEVAERLAALGYVSGTGARAPASGVDPKDRIAIANALHEAMVAVEDAAFARAVPLLETVVSREPDIPIAQLNLGVARARQKQYARAVPPLTRAVALRPDDMRAHYELGSALYETGDVEGAAAQFAAVAAKMPDWADARYSLGSVYARIDRVPDAIIELKAAIALEPRHFRANLLLGRILTLRGDKQAAVPYLRTAVEVQPASTEAKQFLADAEKSSK
jgi:choline-sulfatase